MRRALSFLTVSLGILLIGVQPLKADFKDDWVKPYGLLVHTANRNREVPENKAVEVLYKYFGKTSDQRKSDCQKEIVSCTENPTDIRDFVAWYFRLKNEKTPKALTEKYPRMISEDRRAWVEARRLNLISGSSLTYTSLREFLYRSDVSMIFGGKAYYTGLVISEDEVTRENFRKPNEVVKILESLSADIKTLSEDLTPRNNALVERLKGLKARYEVVKAELKKENSPLVKLQGLTEEDKAKITELGLNEVLSEFTYDYSKNAKYRQHNLITGTMKLNGKVFQPGEEINFMKLLAEKNWNDYVNGWIIEGGKETWAFGGGLCGASTMLFIPSYIAGLEVVERTGHTVFYKSLYPVEYLGLEATIFRPRKNLRLKNNTESPIFFHVHNDEAAHTLTLSIVGNSQYKTIELTGPTQLDKRTYQWVRQMEKQDGTMVREEITTKYNAIK
jgi:vancomycin resistance protein YoaR